MDCAYCGTPLPSGALFCGECGRAVTVRATPPPTAVHDTVRITPLDLREPPAGPREPAPVPSGAPDRRPERVLDLDLPSWTSLDPSSPAAQTSPRLRPGIGGSEAAVPEPASGAPEPAAASEPVASEPVASEPVASEPVASEPAASELAESEPAASEASGDGDVRREPTATPAGPAPTPIDPAPSDDAARAHPAESEGHVARHVAPIPPDAPRPALVPPPLGGRPPVGAPPVAGGHPHHAASPVTESATPPAPERPAPAVPVVPVVPTGRPESFEDVEATRLVTHRPAGARFVLQFSTGESVTVFGTGLLGRNPLPQPGEFFDHLVPLLDPGKSVSKTHLEFGQEGGAFWVLDRFSGNGTVVREPDAAPRRCEPGRRYVVARGARVDIGEQFFVVS